ncbi:hypothetical protein E3T26_12605 [Cryobacterium sp. TMT1-21]|uniref:hypothetical protein n=1 Tax=Cryobacterium sp. TMT1-21 TaxID=1259234 RepID=UPI001069869A|nr:hypothetical protein [Cryobacterium sp. TMT1-21]TFD11516.1 hypothetical protein E3T26_12605 [Cryobacterium sp. TMT1-21]
MIHEALDELDPDGSVVPKWNPSSSRMVACGVRRANVDATEATVGDYEVPNWTWSVRDNGILYGDSLSVGLSRFTFDDAARATEDGYNAHDYSDILLWKSDGGRGGDGAYVDVINFLLQHGVELGTGWAAAWLQAKFLKLRRTRRADAKARLQVKKWETRGIPNPAMMRQWFETRSQWSVLEVAERLELVPYSSQRLLKALGYEPVTGAMDAWSLSARTKARKRRAKWLKSESESWEPEAF